MTAPRRPRRTSSLRRGEAAPAILAAAARLFAERGYAATSIEDIARAADVARPTIFAAVGTKPVIFRAVLEATVAGGGPLAPSEPGGPPPWLAEMLAIDDPAELLRAYAGQTRRIGEWISALYWAAEVAAEQDDAVRELWAVVEGDRLATGPAVIGALTRMTPLRAGYDADSAAVVLTSIVSPASWRALVRDQGWSPDRFERWAGDTMCRLLLADDA